MTKPLFSLAVLLCLGTAMSAAELPEPFGRGWDEKVGLWGGSTKHGKTGHDIRANAGRLAKAGCLGLLAKVPAERVLANLRKAQETKGGLRGNFWWSWEDKKVTDRNSGFFTTMGLLTLRHEFYDQLSDKAQADLDHMLKEAAHWFAHKVIPPQPKNLRYPNAFMGDAICLWLLRELDGSIDDAWRKTFKEILSYYRDQDWGWGEHLSDLYVKICQRELCALLMWAKDLDDETRAIAVGLMGELMGIDAAFAGGPRVPTIRCYWLEKSPRTPEKWSHWYKPFVDIADPEKPVGEFTIAHLAAKRKLFDAIEVPAAPEGNERTVSCHQGSKAVAWVTDRCRYGVMTKYPLFKDTNDHAGYGLHWQSKPMAFWHRAGDWGYLQWLVEEKGKVHALPAITRKSAQQGKLCRLSDMDKRARFGWTRGTRHGAALLIHRELPRVSQTWPWMADRFRLVNPTAKLKRADIANGWICFTATYDEEILTVACRPLQTDTKIALTEADGEWHFTARHDLPKDAERPATFRLVWFVTVAKEAATPPTLATEGGLAVTFADGTKWTFDKKAGWRKTGGQKP